MLLGIVQIHVISDDRIFLLLVLALLSDEVTNATSDNCYHYRYSAPDKAAEVKLSEKSAKFHDLSFR